MKKAPYFWNCAAVISCLLSASADAAPPGTLYTTGNSDGNVYSINPLTGTSALVTPNPIDSGSSDPTAIRLASPTTAYVAGNGDNNIYFVNLATGAFSIIANLPYSPYDIALADSTTAYVALGDNSSNNNYVYSLNLQTGVSSAVTSNIGGGTGNLESIALSNNNIVYTGGYNDNNIYAVNLQTGAFTTLTTIPGAGVQSIALLDATTAYVCGYDDNNIYKVNLQTGEATLVASTPASALWGMVLKDDSTAYVTDNGDNYIYSVDLLTGISTLLTPTPLSSFMMPNIIGLDYYGIVGSGSLSGNNRTFANYLNNNAPVNIIRLFSLTGPALEQAMEAAAPTRNGFATFASQNAFLASSQVVTDHLRQKKFPRMTRTQTQTVAANTASEDLLVDASDACEIAQGAKPKAAPREQMCKKGGSFTGWIGPFGEYAHEKKQNQTPGFSAGLGGAVAGIDYTCADNNVVGVGGAYAYTHVHEEDGAGHANVNQGFLTVYGSANAGNWYFDLALWGGYYHTNNHRKISFPGFNATAKSDTHGWQIAPHFETGYEGWFPWKKKTRFGIDPFLLGDWVGNWEKGFKEHGANELNMGQKGKFCSLFRGESGLRFYEIVAFDWGQLIFLEKASYVYQKMFYTGAVTAFLIGSPGSFTVSSLTGAQNLGVAELSLLFNPHGTRVPNFSIRYQGEFGSQYQSHQGIFEISKDF